jgi:DNA-binding NtrC family response regulator
MNASPPTPAEPPTESEGGKSARILIVDDVPANLNVLGDALEPEGYEILVARSGEAALDSAQRNRPDLILLDVMMPGMDGFETCRRLKAMEATRHIPVIFVTARDETRSVLEGFEVGGVDYVAKPLQTKELLTRVRTHLRVHRLAEELRRKNQELQAEIDQRRRAEEQVSVLTRREADAWGVSGLIGQSEPFRRTLEQVQKVQRFRTTNVVIVGESGTGKELIARAIHYADPIPKGAFVPVNCAAIPRDLAESSFFGHVKGAFSGATCDHKGFFEQAQDGTLFLDEIGDMPLELQVKLLRVLEDGKVVPVGAVKERQVTLRVLAGTNVDLQADIERGRFRQELYYRLAGFTLEVPPLRERRDDLELLARHFLRKFSSEMGMPPPELTPQALELLDRYDYPGNVRELKNLIERALIESGGGAITPEHLHFTRPAGGGNKPVSPGVAMPGSRPRFAESSDEARILAHLEQHESINNSECRDLLGVGLHRACYLLRKLHRAGVLQRHHSRRSAQYVRSRPES